PGMGTAEPEATPVALPAASNRCQARISRRCPRQSAIIQSPRLRNPTLSPAIYADLQQSYGRCLRQDNNFIDRFYQRFLASDPRIEAMFANTDFSKQRMALRRGISMAILHAEGNSIVERPMNQMADVHSSKGRAPVPAELYPLWVRCL